MPQSESDCSEDEVLFSKDKTISMKCPLERTETEYVVPDTVTSIGHSAFENCASLKSIKIPDNVKSIGIEAFAKCPSLALVEKSDKVAISEHMLRCALTEWNT